MQDILDRYQEVFKQELGTLKGYKAQIAELIFANLIQSPMYEKVDEELQPLEKDGAIESLQFADWAVSVLKSHRKSVHICGDFKLTVNQASKLDQYSIPRQDWSLASEKLLDVSQAYTNNSKCTLSWLKAYNIMWPRYV